VLRLRFLNPEFLMMVVVVEHAGARFLGRLHE
jgi:hypothetical protein